MANLKMENSISIKLLKSIFLVYITLTIIMSSGYMYAEYQNTKETIQYEIEALEKTFNKPLTNSIWNFDKNQRETLLNSIYNLRFITGLKLVNKESIVVSNLGDTIKKNELAHKFILEQEFKSKLIKVGELHLYTKPSIIINKVRGGFYFIIFSAIIQSIVLLILLIWIFNKYLSKPIGELTSKVQNIDLNNIENCELLKYNINSDTKNELDIFSKSFAIMLNKINHSLKELDNLNKTLDTKVIEQTKELNSEKQYIQTILDTNPNIIVVTNGVNIISANQSFFDFFGYINIEEFKMHHECICDYFITLDDDTFPKNKLIKGKNWCKYLALNNNTTHQVKLNNLDKDYYFSISVNSMDTNAEMLITMQNITELKHKDQLLLQQSKLASMGEMIGNIAHQWRQPLSAISTAATGMQVQKEYGILTDEVFNESCVSINQNAQYLSKTIDDFKDFIKGDREKRVFNLKNSINSFLHLVDGTIKQYNINIELDVDKDIVIDGYENELTQCIINIFNNAKDILNDKDEDSRCICLSSSVVNDKLILSIKDNGGGIKDDAIAKIFEPYFTTKHKSQGTGLGLHMTYTLIVDGMGGDIEASNVQFIYNNQEFKGAEFKITLPLS
ncbi:MAG: PAS domain-containing sensor histidine kinase [Campylobacterota bacterium]|nr:PAS domain-containing sensor histidine kinase [Campylobacterota bacterium]